ncbi:hypothetical protein ACTWJ8_03785 [Streptomyces sp. SDT5-1]
MTEDELIERTRALTREDRRRDHRLFWLELLALLLVAAVLVARWAWLL